MRYPTRFQQRTIWNAATGVAILVLGALLTGMAWLLGRLFGFLQPVLIPVIVAGIVAYVLDPLVCIFEKRGLSRLKSVVLVYVILITGIAVLLAAVIPGIQRGQRSLSELLADRAHVAATANPATLGESRRLGDTLARNLVELRQKHRGNLIGWALTESEAGADPTAVEQVAPTTQSRPRLEDFSNTRLGKALLASRGAIQDQLKDWAITGSTKLFAFIGLVLGMLMVPVYLFFFLKESAEIRAHWHDYVPLRASRFKTEVVETLQEINGYLISFFRGQVIVAAIDGILVGVALTLFGLPYGFVIGVFMAILGIIPYIGNILCLIPACAIAYLHAQDGGAPWHMGPWPYVACVVAIFVIVQQINSLVTAPKIVGDSVGLHPLTVIFSMLFWTLVLGGFVGALLAVPCTAAMKVLFRRFIWSRQMKYDDALESDLSDSVALGPN